MPSPNSTNHSFLRKRCRDFFFFCLILALYVFLITITGTGCPIRFFTGISCPGCGMSRAVLCLLTGHFSLAFLYHPMVYVVLPAGLFLFFAPERTALQKQGKKILLTVLVIALLAVYFYRIFRHDPLLSIDPLHGNMLQWLYLIKGG